jgi:chitin synthase
VPEIHAHVRSLSLNDKRHFYSF